MKKAVASKKAPRPAPKPQPLLKVVPLDDVTRLLTDGFKASIDEIRELCETMNAPTTVFKPVSAADLPTDQLRPGAVIPSATNDIKPILLLHDSDRITLEALFGGEPLSSPSDVLRLSLRLSTVRLIGPSGEACSTTIPLDTLERLEARRPVDTTLKEMIERGFADYLEGLINGVY